MQTVFSILVDALAYGMVLFIISIGLSVTMGLMRVVNLAHGAFAMIGGYLASYAAHGLGLGYAAAILVAIVGTIVIAIPLERFLYRRIYGAPELTQVLMTIGITFCIIGIANFVFGPTLKTIPLPQELAGPTDLGFRTIATHRIFAIVAGLVVAAALVHVRKDRLRHQVAGSGGQCGHGSSPRRAHRNHLCRKLRHRRRPCRNGRRHRRRIAAGRTLLCAALHGHLPGGRIRRRRRLDPRRADRLSAARRHRYDWAVSCPEYGEFFFYLAVIVIITLFPRGLLGRAK